MLFDNVNNRIKNATILYFSFLTPLINSYTIWNQFKALMEPDRQLKTCKNGVTRKSWEASSTITEKVEVYVQA